MPSCSNTPATARSSTISTATRPTPSTRRSARSISTRARTSSTMTSPRCSRACRTACRSPASSTAATPAPIPGSPSARLAGPGQAREPRFMRPTAEMQERHRAFRARVGVRARSRDGGRSRMRQVVFAACRPNEVAWESGGQGDFTRLTRTAARPLGRDSASAAGRDHRPGVRRGPAADAGAGLRGRSARRTFPRRRPAAGGRSLQVAGPGSAPAEAWARVAESVAMALRARS